MSNTNGHKQVLDADLLTPRDLKAAKVALGGKDVAAMLSDPLEAITLTIYCLRRRENPDFTWDQAEDTPLGEFKQPDGPPDPQTPEPAGNGSVAELAASKS